MFGLDIISTVAGILLIVTSVLVVIAFLLMVIGFILKLVFYKTQKQAHLERSDKLIRYGALFGFIVFFVWFILGFLYRKGVISYHSLLNQKMVTALKFECEK